MKKAKDLYKLPPLPKPPPEPPFCCHPAERWKVLEGLSAQGELMIWCPECTKPNLRDEHRPHIGRFLTSSEILDRSEVDPSVLKYLSPSSLKASTGDREGGDDMF
jgi:hypothetical protein